MKTEHLEELEMQLDYMQGVLESARLQFVNEPLVIEYDNGGGQSGIRKNPFYEAYSQMVKTYASALRAYKEIANGNEAKAPKLVKFENFAKTMKKVKVEG